jgi:hypothetical protein
MTRSRAGAGGALGSDSTGIFVVANKEMPSNVDLTTPYGALMNAFTEVGLNPGSGVSKDLPDGKLRIIVGAKQ